MFALRYYRVKHSLIYIYSFYTNYDDRTHPDELNLLGSFQERVRRKPISLTKTMFGYFRKSKWKAINTQATAT